MKRTPSCLGGCDITSPAPVPLTCYHHLSAGTLGDARIAQIQRLEAPALIDACNAVTLARHANRDQHLITLDHSRPLEPGALVVLNRFRSAGFLNRESH